MSNVLVRGLPEGIHRRIEKMAESQNLSINQLMVRFIIEGAEQAETEEKGRRRDEDAFKRLREFQERTWQKYGISEDSTKMIREFRDNRYR